MKNLATPWSRFLAWAIDVALWFSIEFFVALTLLQINSATDLFNNILTFLIFILYGYLVWFFIVGWMTSKFGGTPGKLLVGIEVVSENGKHISFWRAIFRNTIGYTVSSLLFWLGFIWTCIDTQRQGWHDMVVGTYVVTKKSSWILIGLAALILFLILDIWLGRQLIGQFTSHQKMYQDLFQNLFSNFLPATV